MSNRKILNTTVEIQKDLKTNLHVPPKLNCSFEEPDKENSLSQSNLNHSFDTIRTPTENISIKKDKSLNRTNDYANDINKSSSFNEQTLNITSDSPEKSAYSLNSTFNNKTETVKLTFDYEKNDFVAADEAKTTIFEKSHGNLDNTGIVFENTNESEDGFHLNDTFETKKTKIDNSLTELNDSITKSLKNAEDITNVEASEDENKDCSDLEMDIDDGIYFTQPKLPLHLERMDYDEPMDIDDDLPVINTNSCGLFDATLTMMNTTTLQPCSSATEQAQDSQAVLERSMEFHKPRQSVMMNFDPLTDISLSNSLGEDSFCAQFTTHKNQFYDQEHSNNTVTMNNVEEENVNDKTIEMEEKSLNETIILQENDNFGTIQDEDKSLNETIVEQTDEQSVNKTIEKIKETSLNSTMAILSSIDKSIEEVSVNKTIEEVFIENITKDENSPNKTIAEMPHECKILNKTVEETCAINNTNEILINEKSVDKIVEEMPMENKKTMEISNNIATEDLSLDDKSLKKTLEIPIEEKTVNSTGKEVTTVGISLNNSIEIPAEQKPIHKTVHEKPINETVEEISIEEKHVDKTIETPAEEEIPNMTIEEILNKEKSFNKTIEISVEDKMLNKTIKVLNEEKSFNRSEEKSLNTNVKDVSNEEKSLHETIEIPVEEKTVNKTVEEISTGEKSLHETIEIAVEEKTLNKTVQEISNKEKSPSKTIEVPVEEKVLNKTLERVSNEEETLNKTVEEQTVKDISIEEESLNKTIEVKTTEKIEDDFCFFKPSNIDIFNKPIRTSEEFKPPRMSVLNTFDPLAAIHNDQPSNDDSFLSQLTSYKDINNLATNDLNKTIEDTRENEPISDIMFDSLENDIVETQQGFGDLLNVTIKDNKTNTFDEIPIKVKTTQNFDDIPINVKPSQSFDDILINVKTPVKNNPISFVKPKSTVKNKVISEVEDYDVLENKTNFDDYPIKSNNTYNLNEIPIKTKSFEDIEEDVEPKFVDTDIKTTSINKNRELNDHKTQNFDDILIETKPCMNFDDIPIKKNTNIACTEPIMVEIPDDDKLLEKIISEKKQIERFINISYSSHENLDETSELDIIDSKEEINRIQSELKEEDEDIVSIKKSPENNLLNTTLVEASSKNEISTDVQIEYMKLKNTIQDLQEEVTISHKKINQLQTDLTKFKKREEELTKQIEDSKKSKPENVGIEITKLRLSNTEFENENESLRQQIMQLTRMNEVMQASMEQVVASTEQVQKERDMSQMHLANAEAAFSDVHQKYEGCKLQIQQLKQADDKHKHDIAANIETIQTQIKKYDALKTFALGQIEKCNLELKEIKTKYESEIAKVTAQMRRYEIKSRSLEQTLEQKTRECEQLAAIYDEMVGKV